MNWRLGLTLFCLVHGLLLLRPDWALGYDPHGGAWIWGSNPGGIRMSWYGQSGAGLLAFASGLFLRFRCPELIVGLSVALDLILVVGLQILHPPG